MFVLPTRTLWSFWKPVHLLDPLFVWCTTNTWASKLCASLSRSLSLSTYFLLLVLFFDSVPLCTGLIGHPAPFVSQLVVGASFQVFWMWIFFPPEDSSAPPVSPSLPLCVCLFPASSLSKWLCQVHVLSHRCILYKYSVVDMLWQVVGSFGNHLDSLSLTPQQSIEI